jgi:hypothetical protein
VEEICGKNRRDDGGWKLLVKWKGEEKTWEPYENMAETKVLDEYERLHGRVNYQVPAGDRCACTVEAPENGGPTLPNSAARTARFTFCL